MIPAPIKLLLAACLLLPGMVDTALAQSSRPQYTIPRTSEAPDIDGELAIGEWDRATRIDVSVEINPGNNLVADVGGYALIMEDGVNLYVAFVAEDPDPELIRAFYQDRDEAWNDDYMGITLDTFNDERRAFEFFVNPLGVQIDAIWDDTIQNEDDSWNAIWDSFGQITDFGYVVEIAVPFKQLRFSPSEAPQTWGIDISRHYPRDFRVRIKSQQYDRDVSCYLCQISKVDGFENLDRSRNVQLIPTLTASHVERRDPAAGGAWESADVDPEAGLDVRWGITQDIYLNATLNPDFSQVEADSAQLNINKPSACSSRNAAPSSSMAPTISTPHRTWCTPVISPIRISEPRSPESRGPIPSACSPPMTRAPASSCRATCAPVLRISLAWRVMWPLPAIATTSSAIPPLVRW